MLFEQACANWDDILGSPSKKKLVPETALLRAVMLGLRRKSATAVCFCGSLCRLECSLRDTGAVAPLHRKPSVLCNHCVWTLSRKQLTVTRRASARETDAHTGSKGRKLVKISPLVQGPKN